MQTSQEKKTEEGLHHGCKRKANTIIKQGQHFLLLDVSYLHTRDLELSNWEICTVLHTEMVPMESTGDCCKDSLSSALLKARGLEGRPQEAVRRLRWKLLRKEGNSAADDHLDRPLRAMPGRTTPKHNCPGHQAIMQWARYSASSQPPGTTHRSSRLMKMAPSWNA